MPATPTRRIQPERLYQRRQRRHPIVAGRIAGCQTDWPGTTIYAGSTGSHGSLGDAFWYPNHGNSFYGERRPGAWTIRVDVAGESCRVQAVQDDFGNLVVVPQ